MDEELAAQLYEKMSIEYKQLLEEYKAKTAEEVIDHAYEISCKDNLLIQSVPCLFIEIMVK